QVEREVEGADRADRAEWKAFDEAYRAGQRGLEVDRFVACAEAFDLLGGESQHADRAADLGARVVDGLAGAQRDRALELGAPLGDTAAHRGQYLGAPCARQLARLGEGAR